MEEQAIPITNEQLFQKLCDVEKLLLTPKVEKGLWSIQDIADYMGFSYIHTSTNIVTDPRFPAAIDMKGRKGAKDAKKLFMREEVIKFFSTHKRKKHT